MKKLKELAIKINKAIQNLQSDKVTLFVIPPILAGINVFLSTVDFPSDLMKKALMLMVIIILGIWNWCLLKRYVILTNKRKLIRLKRYVDSFTRIMEDLQKFHSMPK